jgi:anti-anti-sigma factor
MPQSLPSAVPTCRQGAALDCEVSHRERDVVCVHAAGELDIATAPQLELTLREAVLRSRLVVLDLRDLAFIDGCGLHLIDNASGRARRLGRHLVVLTGPPNITRILALSVITDVVDLDRAPRPLPAAPGECDRGVHGRAEVSGAA